MCLWNDSLIHVIGCCCCFCVGKRARERKGGNSVFEYGRIRLESMFRWTATAIIRIKQHLLHWNGMFVYPVIGNRKIRMFEQSQSFVRTSTNLSQTYLIDLQKCNTQEYTTQAAKTKLFVDFCSYVCSTPLFVYISVEFI